MYNTCIRTRIRIADICIGYLAISIYIFVKFVSIYSSNITMIDEYRATVLIKFQNVSYNGSIKELSNTNVGV